jgi:hypothetical protein
MICTALVSLPAKGEVGCTRDIFTERQATLPDCLSNLLGDWDKDIEIVYCEGKIFCTGPTRAAKAGQKSLVPA